MTNTPRSKTDTLIEALKILARDIESEDGVPEACLIEAAQRLDELQKDQDRLDFVEGLSGNLPWQWNLSFNDSGTFICKNAVYGYRSVREAIDQVMEGKA